MVKLLGILLVMVGVLALAGAFTYRAQAPTKEDVTTSTQMAQQRFATTSTTSSTGEGMEGGRRVPTLNLSGKAMEEVPMNVYDHTELVVLNLSHNNLTGALPAEVRHLQNLEWIDLSYNRFTGVPAELGQLTNLRHLDLSHNQLTGLPHELGNLQGLETLLLTGNEYSDQDLAIIRASLPASTRVVVE